jgi:mono/diheme cytochrome c family protein
MSAAPGRIAKLIATFSAAACLGCDAPPPAANASRWTAADHDRLPGEEGPSRPSGPAPKASEIVWAQRCVSCHGAAGNGTGAGGAPVPSFASAAWQRSRTDDELASSIVGGRGAMPRFELPPPVVAELVLKVRGFAAP